MPRAGGGSNGDAPEPPEAPAAAHLGYVILEYYCNWSVMDLAGKEVVRRLEQLT